MKKIAFILSGALLAFGCSEEDNLNVEEPKQTNLPKSVIAGDLETTQAYQYETYDFPNDPDQHLENRLVGIFDGTQTSDIPIDEAIWLWETGANYIFTPYVLAEDEIALDGEVLVWNVSFSLAESKVPNQSFKDEFENSMGILDSLSTAGEDIALTDIRFKELVGSTLNLKFTVALHHDITSDPFSISTGGPFPPAVDDKMLGNKRLCNTGSLGSNDASWKEVQNKTKGVLPKARFVVWPQGLIPGNIFYVTTMPAHIDDRTMPGDWLPGNTNALFTAHQFPAPAAACITASQNDAYTQDLVDEIDAIISKPGIGFQGWATLTVHKQPIGQSGDALWDYDTHLAELMTVEPTLELGLSELGITL